jgi:hypothetical protein
MNFELKRSRLAEGEGRDEPRAEMTREPKRSGFAEGEGRDEARAETRCRR